MSGNRTNNSIKNVTFSFMGYVFTVLLQLLSRSVFVHYLTTEYLGLNGLFSNILSMLALSELGVGTAMTFALYKPVAENDVEKIKSLMYLFKKVYTVIGAFILIVGAALTPFLHLLIAEMPDIKYIRIYYILYVLNSGISYFYSYKRTLIICDQKDYISSITTTIATIVTRISQILILVFTESFMLYLIVQVVVTRLENIWISRIADKKYPYLREKDVAKLPEDEKNQIKNNVKGMLFHKIGYVIVMTTDNLIISKILGLSSVGLYSNYSMIIDSVTAATNKGYYSLSASVGDLIASGDKEKSENIFYKLLFANFWISCFCSVSLFCLLQRFILLWLGDKYLLKDSTIMVLVLCFYFSAMRYTVNIFKESAGIIRQDRFAPIAESFFNLIFSIPLTIAYGITGVKLGTLISTLAVPFWCAAYVLYKYFFQKSCFKYLLLQLKYFSITAICTFCTWLICSKIKVVGLWGLIISGGVCIIVPNLIVLLLFFKTEEFSYFLNIFIKKVSPKKEH